MILAHLSLHLASDSMSSRQLRLYSVVVIATQELLRLTPVYKEVEGGWIQAELVELPGVITAAPSREEAQDMLLDALREFFLSFAQGSPHSMPTGETEGLTLTVNIGRTPAA